MKLARFLMALYVFALAVYPCTDSETCDVEGEGAVAFVESVNHDHSTAEQDMCTPFCICTCCATHVQFGSVTDFTINDFSHNTKWSTHFLTGNILNNEHTIWQPPKLA